MWSKKVCSRLEEIIKTYGFYPAREICPGSNGAIAVLIKRIRNWEKSDKPTRGMGVDERSWIINFKPEDTKDLEGALLGELRKWYVT